MKSIILRIISYAILIICIVGMSKKIQTLHKELDNSVNNEKAYAAENSVLKERNIVFKSTITQLEYLNDSLMISMKKVANENGIKDKNIKALQYQLEHFSKTDTLIVRDTIFREPSFILDTCLYDKWTINCLHLEYPNIIGLACEYTNDKYVILDSHKEPVKQRKWFLPRWFTRKHTIVEVTVVDQNPYVRTERQRFVEIIND